MAESPVDELAAVALLREWVADLTDADASFAVTQNVGAAMVNVAGSLVVQLAKERSVTPEEVLDKLDANIRRLGESS